MLPNNKRSLYRITGKTYVAEKTRVDPQFMIVKINNVDVKMEIDSGAAMSIIPLKIKENILKT